MNNTIDMTYASQNDCAELSPVVADPEIFLVRRSILSCARPTVAGSTPARSSRAFTASRPSTPRSSSMSRNEDTFAARYSAAPVSTVRSTRMRSPSTRLRPTSRVKESNSPARGADRATMMKVLPRASESATRAPNPDVVPSTTTMALVPPAAAKCRGMMMIAAKKRGPRMAETQNHLLRTRSTNSRRITARILRTHRLRPDQVDEDLVQRRLLQLEPGQPRPRCHESLEDLLGVGAGRELDLGILPIVVYVAHQGLVGEHLRRPAQAPIEPEDEMVPTMCPLDVRERAVHQLPSARDDAQLLAQLLGLLHDVGREQDRLPATAQVEHGVLHHLSIDGIEPREGLVENQEIRVVEHGRNELHLLLHPLGQLVDPSQSPLGEAESREPFLSPLTRPPSIGAFHLAEKDENVEHPHLAVQAALLGEVADPLRVGSPPARLAEYAHGPAVGLQEVHDHAKRGRFPGAVRPEQTVNHATGHGQRQLIDGGVTGEAFADPIEDQYRGRGGRGGGGGRRHVRGANLAPWGLDCVGQGVPGKQGALDADGELRHAGQGTELAQRLIPRGALVPLHHGAHPIGQGECLVDRLVLDELGHHRGRRLTDGAAPADEACFLDDVAVDTQLQVDLVPTERVVQRHRVGRLLQRPLVAGPPVVIEDQLLVEGAELRIRRGRIQTGLPP